MKTEFRGAALAVAVLLTWFAGPAAAQTNCTTDSGRLRQSPFCYNAPNTALAGPADPRVVNGSNDGFTTQAGERLACPRADGGDGSYGATTWYAFHPHATGYLGVLLRGIDAQLVMEEDTGPPDTARAFVCSDDSGAIDVTQELLAVRGLEAGKTYLLQIGGLKRLIGVPYEGDLQLAAGFVPDRDNDLVGDADDGLPGRRSRRLSKRVPGWSVADGRWTGSVPLTSSRAEAGSARAIPTPTATASAAPPTGARTRAHAVAISTRTAARTASARRSTSSGGSCRRAGAA